MKNVSGHLAAPFPYFGGKSLAVDLVWSLFGKVQNYVEPFAGSAAMLLGAPDTDCIATLNDADGFICNFWRAIVHFPQDVAKFADWPVNETDLFARHSYLVNRRKELTDKLHGDPDFCDPKLAGWWVWGACAWIGSGWCSGKGPWVHDGTTIVDSRKLPHLSGAGRGINRKLPHLSGAGKGINRQLPHLSGAGNGINRQLPHLSDAGRGGGLGVWFADLSAKLRQTRVTCGDWSRVCKDSVTTHNGLTAVFLDPPYTIGDMDYAVGGMGGALANDVQAWCLSNGNNELLRIVICGHAGEHDKLLDHGWRASQWTAGSGYAKGGDGVANYKKETVWASPHCMSPRGVSKGLFD